MGLITSGICDERNGVQCPFAQQQFLETDVRFGSKADILRCGKRSRYSITSSARPDTGSGMVIPSALAVLKLMISWIFVAR
jgi:hypothetical protein